jgi:hypothetical protein
MKPHPRPPKFIREYYNPTAREWLRWLRFKRKVIAIAKQGHSALEDYWNACAKSRRLSTGGFVRCGMAPGSGSSCRTLEMFPWAWFDRSISFQGVMLTLSCDRHDSDIASIVSTNDF